MILGTYKLKLVKYKSIHKNRNGGVEGMMWLWGSVAQEG